MEQKFTDTQTKELREAFELFDKDGNGAIDERELGAVMRAFGQNPTEEELQDMIDNLDANGNGKIDFDEFLIMMERAYKEQNELEAELVEAFKVFDVDKSGYIELWELRKLLKDLGEQFTEEQVQSILGNLDLDGDGKLNYREFAKAACEK